MKYFCSKCGKTTLYNFEMPKFCSYCGQSFGNKLTSVEVEDQRNKFLNELKLKKNINSATIQDIEEEPINENINFKKIKPSFKVDVYQNKGESFGSLLENPSQPIDIEKNTIPSKTTEQILEEFKKEAGLSRNQE